MISTQVRQGIHSISAVENNRRGFEGSWYTADGVMFNSYWLSCGGQDMVVGTMPQRCIDEWMDWIRAREAKGRPGYLVIFGMEEDLAAADALLSVWPEITVIGSPSALYRLEGLTKVPFRELEIRTDRGVDAGGRRIRFSILPDTKEVPSLYMLDEKTKVLFTADAFAAYYAPQMQDGVFVNPNTDRARYVGALRGYYESFHGAGSIGLMEKAAALVRSAGAEVICPVRGPLIDTEKEKPEALAQELMAHGREQSRPEDPAKVLAIVYESNAWIGKVAARMENGAAESAGEETGIRVERYDLGSVSREAAMEGIRHCDAFLLGTTQKKDDAARSIWDIVTSLSKEECEGKMAAVISQGQPDGSVALQLRVRLGSLGCDISWKDFRVIGKPDDEVLKYAEDYGFGLGCRLQRIPNPRTPSLVKCLVCGEIFDASLGTCPVCGVGLDQCVPVEEDEAEFREDSDRRYIILGGGTAGISAADAIRQRDASGSIDLFSAEDVLPINRPMLTKDVDIAAAEDPSIFVHEKSWYEERGITMHLGCAVTRIDTDKKCIETAEGEEFAYDRLIYAMGAECFIPPFEGWNKKGVLTIRHLKDCEELAARMASARKAVVIGGGVLGLEAASEIMRSGIEVTVLEASPQIVGRQVDAGTAAILRRRMEAMHIACHEAVSIAGVDGEEQAEAVRLADGRVFPCDFVVVSCGNRGNIAAAKEAGIHVERSIVVNRRMETSAEDVYACGDCAQLEGLNFQLWQEASEQGKVAGANAAGDDLMYEQALLGLSLEGFGTSLFAIGDVGKKENVSYRTLEIHDGVRSREEKYWFSGSLLQGAVLINTPEKITEVTQNVREHAEYGSMV